MTFAVLFWDIFRFLDLAIWATSFGIALRVMFLYSLVYSHRHDPRERRHGAGLLPLHVSIIALSWLILSGSAVATNIERIGDPFSLYIPANFIGFSFGLVALITIQRYEHRRVNPPDPRVQDTTSSPWEDQQASGSDE